MIEVIRLTMSQLPRCSCGGPLVGANLDQALFREGKVEEKMHRLVSTIGYLQKFKEVVSLISIPNNMQVNPSLNLYRIIELAKQALRQRVLLSNSLLRYGLLIWLI